MRIRFALSKVMPLTNRLPAIASFRNGSRASGVSPPLLSSPGRLHGFRIPSDDGHTRWCKMNTVTTIPFLSEETLAGLGITTGDVIEIIEALIRGRAQNTVWSAPKAVILPSDGRYMMAALAAMDNPSLLAVK